MTRAPRWTTRPHSDTEGAAEFRAWRRRFLEAREARRQEAFDAAVWRWDPGAA